MVLLSMVYVAFKNRMHPKTGKSGY